MKLNNKFILLCQTLWALWLASAGMPKLTVFVVLIIGIFVTTWKADQPLKRTTFVLLCGINLALISLTNWVALIVVAVGIALITLHHWQKDRSGWSEVLLALIYAGCVPLAFAAQNHTIQGLSWIIYSSVAAWTLLYRSSYLLSIEHKTSNTHHAFINGFKQNPLLNTALLQMLTLMCLILSGIIYGQGLFYFIALLIVMMTFIYQLRSIQKNQKASFRWIFLSHNWLAALMLISTIINYHY